MNRQHYKTTVHSREYKILKRRMLNNYKGLCPICNLRGGCNFWNKRREIRNWKKYRKTQWKGKIIHAPMM